MITGLGNEVDAIVEISPTLLRDLASLREDGWVIDTQGILLTQDGRRGECLRGVKNRRISIDPRAPATELVAVLAHEVGHARSNPEALVRPHGLTRTEFVTANYMRHLRDEAEAVLYNYEVRDEIKRHGGPEIAMTGPRAAAALLAADNRNTERDTLRDKLAALYTDEGGPSPLTSFYRNNYRRPYEVAYDRLPEHLKVPESEAGLKGRIVDFLGKSTEQMHSLGLALAADGTLRQAALAQAADFAADKADIAADIAPSAEMKRLLADSPAVFKAVARAATGRGDALPAESGTAPGIAEAMRQHRQLLDAASRETLPRPGAEPRQDKPRPDRATLALMHRDRSRS